MAMVKMVIVEKTPPKNENMPLKMFPEALVNQDSIEEVKDSRFLNASIPKPLKGGAILSKYCGNSWANLPTSEERGAATRYIDPPIMLKNTK